MTSEQFAIVPSLKQVGRGNLVAQRTQMDWIVALHQLAASELTQTYVWAAYQGVKRLESLERKVDEAERSGSLSPDIIAEFRRCVVKHRVRLVELADQAGFAIAGILSR